VSTTLMSVEERTLTETREKLLEARAALLEFRREHGAMIDGRPVWFRKPELRPELDREYAALVQAEDAASTNFQTALKKWSDSKAR